MTGVKRNEGATVVGERVGTRATAKFIRGSSTKARQVLDLIRGLDVQRADDVLRFTEREMAATIRKVLASAVANAEHNDSQGRDELYVIACFADEGPTLRRYRPRARGRATRRFAASRSAPTAAPAGGGRTCTGRTSATAGRTGSCPGRRSPAATSSWPVPPTSPASPSPTPSRSTRAATSSGRSSATP